MHQSSRMIIINEWKDIFYIALKSTSYKIKQQDEIVNLDDMNAKIEEFNEGFETIIGTIECEERNQIIKCVQFSHKEIKEQKANRWHNN